MVPSEVSSAAARLGRMRRGLPSECSYVACEAPVRLREPDQAIVRDALVAVSSDAFGADTRAQWERRFAGAFLHRLDRFFVLLNRDGELIGWTSCRAATLRRQRCVYFDTTGLRPDYQRNGVMRAVQRAVVARELRRNPLRAVRMIVRTRSPVVYRTWLRTFGARRTVPRLDGSVPDSERAFLAEIAAWLDQRPFDAATSRVAGAYADRAEVYGETEQPRTGDQTIDDLFDALPEDDAILLVGRTNLLGVLRASTRRR